MSPDDLSRRDAAVLIALGGAGVACGGSGADPDAGMGTDAAMADASIDAPLVDVGADAGFAPLTPEDFGMPSCVLTPAQGMGPYYYPVELERLDIREGRPGALLRFGVRVVDEDCNPLPGYLVDAWHCDALGVYAGFPDADPDEPPPGGLVADTSETFCRGVRPTNAEGIAEFVTLYPGWYSVRTAHIHLKIVMGRSTLVTTQAYFDDAYTDMVYLGEPYATRPDRQTFNDEDGGFDTATLIDARAHGEGHLGTLTVAIAV